MVEQSAAHRKVDVKLQSIEEAHEFLKSLTMTYSSENLLQCKTIKTLFG